MLITSAVWVYVTKNDIEPSISFKVAFLIYA